jgi:hypothetical protein
VTRCPKRSRCASRCPHVQLRYSDERRTDRDRQDSGYASISMTTRSRTLGLNAHWRFSPISTPFGSPRRTRSSRLTCAGPFSGELHRHQARFSPVNFTEYSRVLTPANRSLRRSHAVTQRAGTRPPRHPPRGPGHQLPCTRLGQSVARKILWVCGPRRYAAVRVGYGRLESRTNQGLQRFRVNESVNDLP